ncbi:MAG: hypothetical protein M3Q58_06365 [Bacteroidota bacterium]|nr:hypothetical protein [Bacteroidota bacterium]
MKNKILNSILIFAFVIFAEHIYAQTATNVVNVNENMEQAQVNGNLVKAQLGTYQFIRTSKIEEVFTVEKLSQLLIEAEKNRHETEEKRYEISQYTNIWVLSKSTINAPDFIPVEEFVYKFD